MKYYSMFFFIICTVMVSGSFDTGNLFGNTNDISISTRMEVNITPDTFLRLWDPITIEYKKNKVKKTGPEDNPENHIRIEPEHPGVYRWISKSTLMFRPSTPWPPLTSYVIKTDGIQKKLLTLMSSPVRTIPADGDRNLTEISDITLEFDQPVNSENLKKMVLIEVINFPGIDRSRSKWLNEDDFALKVPERAARNANAVYIIQLKNRISYGKTAIIHLKLSSNPSLDDTFHKIEFSTQKPFRIEGFGSQGSTVLPVSVSGSQFSKEQAIVGNSSNKNILIQFSSDLGRIIPSEARNLIKFSPGVENLKFTTQSNNLLVYGDFHSETLYKVTLTKTELTDQHKRKLEMEKDSSFYIYFKSMPEFIEWDSSGGIIELYGAKTIPVSSRNFSRADLRLYKLDPLNRSFWPFPDHPVTTDDLNSPPAPGEELSSFTDHDRYIYENEITLNLKTLGTPDFSGIINLPIHNLHATTRFGLDLNPVFEKLHGVDTPGTYLIGLRKIDQSSTRSWIRLQVTDLCVTTAEEPDTVRFFVTSLKTGLPVSNAVVSVEGTKDKLWKTLISGKTDKNGMFRWKIIKHKKWDRYNIMRLFVQKGNDTLVLNPSKPPEKYYNNTFETDYYNWLQWTQQDLFSEKDEKEFLTHIFTERPIYKPNEPVHIKGYVRFKRNGDIRLSQTKGTLILDCPGDLEYQYEVPLNKNGSFYHLFQEEKLPGGEYTIYFQDSGTKQTSPGVTFKKEAYQVPKFEVNLTAPDKSPLDESFHVELNASYYAGGSVIKQPVRWRVTQFPYNLKPEYLEGYYYSTDARFSGSGQFKSNPTLNTTGMTDTDGLARIKLDPALEPTSQPRKYIIEATVTGIDDQTVTATHEVKALPPFVLGLKMERYYKKADYIYPEIIAVDLNNTLIENKKIKIRLLKREWHSYLKAGDFTRKSANYITNTIDSKILEKDILSKNEPVKIKLPVDSSGVYIVEIESRDKLGRSQLVSVDLFNNFKEEPVTWSKPPSKTFQITTSKNEYKPGSTASVIIESPYQKARVLAVLEEPDGNNIYKWVDVHKGKAVFNFKVKKAYIPKIPIHFILMRGRFEKPDGIVSSNPDLEKPITLSSTTWISVLHEQHKVITELEYPETSMPGKVIDVAINLKDETGKPIPGEVTLWLVDQSVLALANEKRLDPLPDFITAYQPGVSFHDTRNIAFGRVPLYETPGGGMSRMAESKSILENITVRKNFNPVPYYNPSIHIDKSGSKVLRVLLPDNLTNFKLRAKSISGPDRFGYAKGHISIRLPVIVKPSLPRFIRSGDHFKALAVTRSIDGTGGEGLSEIQANGLSLNDVSQKKFSWDENMSARIEFDVTSDHYNSFHDIQNNPQSISIVMGVKRISDEAGDGFNIKIPLLPDRKNKVIKNQYQLDNTLLIPSFTEAFRKNTLSRTYSFTGNKGILNLITGLNYLIQYPHGCTEQKISKARGLIASLKFKSQFNRSDYDEFLNKTVKLTLTHLENVQSDNGLAAYWPGSSGNVSLTAWVVNFMIEAEAAGFEINQHIFDAYIHALKSALRTDYAYFIDGESFSERCWALSALAAAGESDMGYVTELARKSEYLTPESLSQVIRSLYQSGESVPETLELLLKKLNDSLKFELNQGDLVYQGLNSSTVPSKLILPSEIRALSEILRTFSVVPSHYVKSKTALTNALINLADTNGWGNTNTNSSALLALSDVFSDSESHDMPVSLKFVNQNNTQEIHFSNTYDIKHVSLLNTEKIDLLINETETGKHETYIQETISYVPLKPGNFAKPQFNGFSVKRDSIRIGNEDNPDENLEMTINTNEINHIKGDIIEEHVEVVCPEDRHYVSVIVPLAAGMEPLNPSLNTSPPEAKPNGNNSLLPTYMFFADDHMAYYYNILPKGTYHFYFRTRAQIVGSFTQPPAYAEDMYNQLINGSSSGAKINISDKQ